MDQESPDPIPVQATRIAELQLPGWTVQQHLQQAERESKDGKNQDPVPSNDR